MLNIMAKRGEDYQTKEKNNLAQISGSIVECIYDHEVFGERFYTMHIGVERKSKTIDYVPIIISERLLDKESINDNILVEGQVRTYNKIGSDGKFHLIVRLFAKKIWWQEREMPTADENLIKLVGTICKQPIYRVTPFGRKICELLLAVNRENYKSDYIPCIAWEQAAQLSKDLIVGSRIKIEGRFQSRSYRNSKGEDKIAYEISISQMFLPKAE